MKKKIILISTLLIIGQAFCFTCFLMFGYTTKLRVQIKNIELNANSNGIVIYSTDRNQNPQQTTISLDSLKSAGQSDQAKKINELERAVLESSVADVERVLLIVFIIGLTLIILSGVLVRSVLKNDKVTPAT